VELQTITIFVDEFQNPIVLVGHSVGGLIANEVCTTLNKLSDGVEHADQVSLLGVYDGEVRSYMCGVGKEDIGHCVPRHSSSRIRVRHLSQIFCESQQPTCRVNISVA